MADSGPIDWSQLESSLAGIPGEVGARPRAVLVVTAHWEASGFTFQTNPAPPMLYDYGGFPPETYEIEYPAPGAPEVAESAIALLEQAGLPFARDPERGFDHGTFVPLYVMYPDADVPVVQMSIDRGFDPGLHLDAGRALAPLREQGILIVGSGLPSFHDLSAMGPASQESSRAFDAWLAETMLEHIGERRSQRLLHWADAPAARRAHPREDHFIPLLVAVGAAEEDRAVRNYHESDSLGGWTTSSAYRLGDPAV